MSLILYRWPLIQRNTRQSMRRYTILIKNPPIACQKNANVLHRGRLVTSQCIMRLSTQYPTKSEKHKEHYKISKFRVPNKIQPFQTLQIYWEMYGLLDVLRHIASLTSLHRFTGKRGTARSQGFVKMLKILYFFGGGGRGGRGRHLHF